MQAFSVSSWFFSKLKFVCVILWFFFPCNNMSEFGSNALMAFDHESDAGCEAAINDVLDDLLDSDLESDGDDDTPDLLETTDDDDMPPNSSLPEGMDELHFTGCKHGPPLRRVTGKQAPAEAALKLPEKVIRRASDIKAESLGLHGIFFRRMVALGVPGWFFMIIYHLRRMTTLVLEESVEAVEFYVGRRTIQRAYASEHHPALAFDKSDHYSHDFCTDIGFLHAVMVCLLLRARGLPFWATVCSTWVFMSRSSVWRFQEQSLGCTRLQCVRDANLMVSRMVLLIRFLAGKFCQFGLEQPATSLMDKTPRMKAMSRCPQYLLNGQFTKCQTYMAAYGTPIHKPTSLWSSGTWIRDLVRAHPQGFQQRVSVTSKKVKNGKTCATGNEVELKESQGYTDQFGRAVMRAFLDGKQRASEFAAASFDVDSDEELTTDSWDDCMPAGVMKLLNAKLRSPW